MVLFLQLFGYFQSGVEDEELTVGEEVSIFMVSKRRRVGEAAGKNPFRVMLLLLFLGGGVGNGGMAKTEGVVERDGSVYTSSFVCWHCLCCLCLWGKTGRDGGGG